MTDDKIKLTVPVPPQMFDDLETLADKTGNSVASIIRLAIVKELAEWSVRDWRPYIWPWPQTYTYTYIPPSSSDPIGTFSTEGFKHEP